MRCPFLARPIVRHRSNPAHFLNGPIKIAGTIEKHRYLSAHFGRLRTHVDNRGLSYPLFVVDLDGIIANCDDEIGLTDKSIDIRTTGTAQHTGPMGMTLGQKPFGMKGRNERNLLRLDKF